KDFVILHGLDGYDEISLTGPFKYFFNKGERVAAPADLGLPQVTYADITGGNSVEESAKIFLNILEGKGTEKQQDVVIANSAMALFCADQQAGIEQAVSKAREALVSGKAYEVFKKLMSR